MILRIILFLSFISCSSSQSSRLVKGGNLDNVYISNGLEQFFLADLPHWANFSSAAKCHRNSSIRFLHFENLKSYNLNYKQAVHLQHMFNRKNYAYKTSSAGSSLQPKDESYIFYNVYQQVIGERFDFIVPKFNKISIVLVDSYLANTKRLIKIVKSKEVLGGHPILLSQCLNSYELEDLARKLKLDELGVKFLSSDMFNIYSEELEPQTSFGINISEFLGEKSISVFGPKSPENIHGTFQFNLVP